MEAGVAMKERIDLELALLRGVYPDVAYNDRWVLVPKYPLPPGWSSGVSDTAFFIRDGFPGVSPYGIYVPAGLRFNGATPNNYAEPAGTQPPFGGTWGIFSWEAVEWHPTADPKNGHNLLNWVQGFAQRFREGM